MNEDFLAYKQQSAVGLLALIEGFCAAIDDPGDWERIEVLFGEYCSRSDADLTQLQGPLEMLSAREQAGFGDQELEPLPRGSSAAMRILTDIYLDAQLKRQGAG